MTRYPTHLDARASSQAILEYWFATLDDHSTLDAKTEPFRTCFARWYGKQATTDADVRSRFQPLLQAVTRDERAWDDAVSAFAEEPRGLVALLVLTDQMPRNMFRDTPRMYSYDADNVALAERAIARHVGDDQLPLVYRVFLYTPLMHAEDLSVQGECVARFAALHDAAKLRSPHNAGFFAMAADFARRHQQAIEQFGRFPHRNAIFGRESSRDELAYLAAGGGF